MIRLILIGIWASLLTVASSYATMHYSRTRAAQGEAAPQPVVEARKTKEINVPKIRGGVVAGYVVLQFTYFVDTTALKQAGLSPDAFVIDEAFRQIYDDETIDFTRLEKVDLNALGHSLITKINNRMKAPVITDIAFQEFTFMSATEAKSGN